MRTNQTSVVLYYKTFLEKKTETLHLTTGEKTHHLKERVNLDFNLIPLLALSRGLEWPV